MLVRTSDGIVMEFTGDAVFIGNGSGDNGVYLEGGAVPDLMKTLRMELDGIMIDYHRKLVSCLDQNALRQFAGEQ